MIGTTLTLLGLGLVQAATACALVELDARPADRPRPRLPDRARRIRPLLGAIALFVAVWVVLTTTAFLIPVAIWLAVRWCLLAPGRRARGPLRTRARSAAAAGSSGGAGSASARSSASAPLLALVAGPLLGALLIFVTEAPLALLNLVAGVVYALALPFVALVTAYVYFDARARVELEPVDARRELPAEIDLPAQAG